MNRRRFAAKSGAIFLNHLLKNIVHVHQKKESKPRIFTYLCNFYFQYTVRVKID